MDEQPTDDDFLVVTVSSADGRNVRLFKRAASDLLGVHLRRQASGKLELEGVAVGSLAEKHGLKPGDVIEAINGVHYATAHDAINALRAAIGDVEVRIAFADAPTVCLPAARHPSAASDVATSAPGTDAATDAAGRDHAEAHAHADAAREEAIKRMPHALQAALRCCSVDTQRALFQVRAHNAVIGSCVDTLGCGARYAPDRAQCALPGHRDVAALPTPALPARQVASPCLFSPH